eukprot:701783-Hanusia_phi.AAC.1
MSMLAVLHGAALMRPSHPKMPRWREGEVEAAEDMAAPLPFIILLLALLLTLPELLQTHLLLCSFSSACLCSSAPVLGILAMGSEADSPGGVSSGSIEVGIVVIAEAVHAVEACQGTFKTIILVMKKNQPLPLDLLLFSLLAAQVSAISSNPPRFPPSDSAFAPRKQRWEGPARLLRGGGPESLGEYGGIAQDAIEFLRSQKIAPTKRLYELVDKDGDNFITLEEIKNAFELLKRRKLGSSNETRVPTVIAYRTNEYINGKIYLVGDWSEWLEFHELAKNSDNAWEAMVSIPAGRRQFKFVVNGNWLTSHDYPIVDDGVGTSGIHLKIRMFSVLSSLNAGNNVIEVITSSAPKALEEEEFDVGEELVKIIESEKNMSRQILNECAVLIHTGMLSKAREEFESGVKKYEEENLEIPQEWKEMEQKLVEAEASIIQHKLKEEAVKALMATSECLQAGDIEQAKLLHKKYEEVCCKAGIERVHLDDLFDQMNEIQRSQEKDKVQKGSMSSNETRLEAAADNRELYDMLRKSEQQTMHANEEKQIHLDEGDLKLQQANHLTDEKQYDQARQALRQAEE